MKREHRCTLHWIIAVAGLLVGVLSGCGEKDRFIERSVQVINDGCGAGADFFVIAPNVLGKDPLTLIIQNSGKCAIRVLTAQPPNGTLVERLVAPAGTTKSYTIAILDTSQIRFHWECKSTEDSTKRCNGTVELYQPFHGSTEHMVNAIFEDSLLIGGPFHTLEYGCSNRKLFVEHKNGSDESQQLRLTLTNALKCPVRLWGVSLPPQAKPFDTTEAASGKTINRLFPVAAGTTVLFYAECYGNVPIDSIKQCGWDGSAFLLAD